MNGNNNNNSNDRDARRAMLEKKIQEQRQLKEILTAVRVQFETSNTMKRTLENPNYKQDYSEERKILASFNNAGLAEGMLAGVATFVFLRRGPQMMLRLFSRNNSTTTSGGRSGYRLDRPSSISSGQQQQRQPFNSSQQQQEPRSNPILGGIKLAIDVFVSLLMAASTSFSMVNEKELAHDFAKLPLVSGNSLASDEFCSTISREIGARSLSKTSTDNVYLLSLVEFSRNCRKRHAYEDQLRQQQGLGANEPVTIPAPGVPEDIIMIGDTEEDDEMFGATTVDDFATDSMSSSSFGNTTTNQDGGDYFGSDPAAATRGEWGDDLTTDREDDWKK